MSTSLRIVFAVCYSRNQLITQDLLLKKLLTLANGKKSEKVLSHEESPNHRTATYIETELRLDVGKGMNDKEGKLIATERKKMEKGVESFEELQKVPSNTESCPAWPGRTW